MTAIPGELRLAIAMFTVLPVPRSWHVDATRDRAVTTLRWLPGIGAALGALAGLPTAAVLSREPSATLLAAVLGIGALALLSRGLHLDGLADTADGLGSRAPAERALEIMRRSDVGPFGVLTLALVLLIDVSALAATVGDSPWRAVAALAVAAATGRVAVAWAALPGMAAARDGSGFGALVAGGTRLRDTVLLSLLVLGGGAGLAAVMGANPVGWPVAQALALVAAATLRAHTTRRLGGVTGDVFGALIECATAVTLVGLAVAG